MAIMNEMSICGNDAVFMPAEECDSCEQFMSDIQRIDRKLVEVDTELAGKQATLTAGENITLEPLEDGTTRISSTGGGGGGTSYTAGDGIEIVSNVISALRNPTNTYTKAEVDMYLSRNAFRGKLLGNALTAEQAEAISLGDFTDLWNGDYWEINGHNWRIVDNTGYFGHKKSLSVASPHLIVMPDDCLLKPDGTSRYMNAENTTAGAYAGTRYRQVWREQCRAQFNAAFGSDHVATFSDAQTTSVANGHAATSAVTAADVELPSELSMYGSTVWGDGYGQGYNTGLMTKQFALFRMTSDFLVSSYGTDERYWLRDVVSSANFAAVEAGGLAASINAAEPAVGIRPFAVII